ncbi:hypothetical protein RNO09_20610, partial [Escherichia coli]|nr:hypothetical protein [Escherichia coli]
KSILEKTLTRWPVFVDHFRSDYLEACRESYAPPYTIGKNKFIP